MTSGSRLGEEYGRMINEPSNIPVSIRRIKFSERTISKLELLKKTRPVGANADFSALWENEEGKNNIRQIALVDLQQN